MVASHNPYKLSDARHQEVYEHIRVRSLARSQAREAPLAIITGGQPGAGKSGIADQARQELREQGGFVLVDADRLREQHPLYQAALRANDREAANLTHPDAGRWAARLQVDAAAARRNLLIDQTSKDPAALEQLTRQLRSTGYRIELRVMAVNSLVSEQRIHTRYETAKAARGFARFSTRSNHDMAYEGLVRTVKAAEQGHWADVIAVYDKDHRLIRRKEFSQKSTGSAVGMQITDELIMERNRKFSLDEACELVDQYSCLNQMLKVPARGATAEETHQMALCHRSAELFKKAAVFRNLSAEKGVKIYPDLEIFYVVAALIKKIVGEIIVDSRECEEILKQVQNNLTSMIEEGHAFNI